MILRKRLHRSIHISYFLSHWIRISDILSWVRNAYLAHVILDVLSRDGCTFVVLDLTRMLVNYAMLKRRQHVTFASQRIQELLEAFLKHKMWYLIVRKKSNPLMV